MKKIYTRNNINNISFKDSFDYEYLLRFDANCNEDWVDVVWIQKGEIKIFPYSLEEVLKYLNNSRWNECKRPSCTFTDLTLCDFQQATKSKFVEIGKNLYEILGADKNDLLQVWVRRILRKNGRPSNKQPIMEMFYYQEIFSPFPKHSATVNV